MNYKVKWCSKAVYFEFDGTLTLDESVNGIGLLIADPRFYEIEYQFVNFCNIVNLGLNDDDIMPLTALTKLPSKWNPKLRIIFISSNNNVSTYLKKYCKSMEEFGITIELVSSINRAKQLVRKKKIIQKK